MPLQKPQPGAKRKYRKERYIKGYSSWMGIHKETQVLANRHSRRNSGVSLEARVIKTVEPPQGKTQVASNRCGNDCGRRAAKEDYLCSRCRE